MGALIIVSFFCLVAYLASVFAKYRIEKKTIENRKSEK